MKVRKPHVLLETSEAGGWLTRQNTENMCNQFYAWIRFSGFNTETDNWQRAPEELHLSPEILFSRVRARVYLLR